MSTYKVDTRVVTNLGTGFVTKDNRVKLDNPLADLVSVSEVLYCIKEEKEQSNVDSN